MSLFLSCDQSLSFQIQTSKNDDFSALGMKDTELPTHRPEFNHYLSSLEKL